jgi:hypothetical protein
VISRGEIALTQKQLYRAGRIATRAGLGIDPNQVFADPDKADEAIAVDLLHHVYTAMPIDADAFKKEFTDAEAGKLFNALFGGSTQTGDLSAIDNFAIGLALTSKRRPKEFDPVNCTFFATIRDELAQAGGELRLYSFYEKYTGPAFGLLQEMVTLYLLAFVRLAQPHCYFTVKSEAGLKLNTGKAPLDNRIGPPDVVQVTWTRGRLHRAFDRLVQAVGPSWNDLVEFARIIDDSLKATTERAETETQQERLIRSQQQWHEKLEGLRPRLQRLAQALHGNATPFLALVDRVDRICRQLDSKSSNGPSRKISIVIQRSSARHLPRSRPSTSWIAAMPNRLSRRSPIWRPSTRRFPMMIRYVKSVHCLQPAVFWRPSADNPRKPPPCWRPAKASNGARVSGIRCTIGNTAGNVWPLTNALASSDTK